MKFVDLFSGWGGMRYAAEEVGWECAGSWENDPDIQKCYEAVWGHPPNGDVKEIDKLPKGCDILIAGFPCQSFSSLGNQKGFLDKTRGTLFYEVLRIAKANNPRVVILENVRNLKSHDDGKTYETIIGALREDLGYYCTDSILNAVDFGCACNRPRIFIVCFRDSADMKEFSFYPMGWIKPNAKRISSCFLPASDIPESAWLTQTALDGLKKHKERHQAKGNGWGYTVLNPARPAHTFSTSGNGSEHNLIVDRRPGAVGANKNSDGLRMLLPEERAKAMGFPSKFVIPSSRDLGNTVVGNSVAIPVVRHLFGRVNEVLS